MRDATPDNTDGRVASVAVASVPLDIDVKVENACLLDTEDAEVPSNDEESDSAAETVLRTLSCVDDDTSFCFIDVTEPTPPTTDVQSCSQMMMIIINR